MTFIVASVVLVGLLWGAILALRGSLVAGCLALLVVGYCFGHAFLNFDLGSIPLTLDRLVLGGLIAVYAIQVGLGIIARKPLTRLDVALLALVGVLTISTFSGDWRSDVPGKVSPLWLLVAGYVTPAAIYFIARDARLSERGVLATYITLALFGLYLAITALAENFQQWWLVYPTYIADPGIGVHFGRARGPGLQSFSLGLYLAMCLVCAWAARTKLGRPAQLAFLAAMPLFLAAIYFTDTRCVWLGTAMGGLIVLGLTLRGAWRPLVLATLVGMGLVATVLRWDQMVDLEREGGAAASRDSIVQRAGFAYLSWNMFLDRPLFGFGFGQFTQAKLPYLADRSTSLDLESLRNQPHHNTLLSLLVETGPLGGGLYLAVLAGWACAAWRMLGNKHASAIRTQAVVMLAALGIYAGPAMFYDASFSPHDHWLLFFLAGITMNMRGASHNSLDSAEIAARNEDDN